MKRKKGLTKKEVEVLRIEATKLQAEMPAGTFVIGSNAGFGQCSVCGAKDEELRPYGKNGADICYSCGQKDKKETERQMRKVMGL